MKYPKTIREEELKNRVARDFFERFDTTEIIKNIDFAVRRTRPSRTLVINNDYLLWAEAKASVADISIMLAQLVLTIGKARTFDNRLPPPLLGCFDCEKIAFVPYCDIQHIFYQNDFNWNITPSDHESREFKQVKAQVDKILGGDETCVFDFEKDYGDLKQFVHDNFFMGEAKTARIKIDKNNFISVYNKWREAVQPTIAVNWEKAKERGIIDGDFYLADLLSAKNKTIRWKLFVLLEGDYYEFDRVIDDTDFYNSKRADFSDRQKAHRWFWAKYERPPAEQYWDYIIQRRDLLVPQDVRERKGSFFTPRRWVELSQKYLAEQLGDDWQEEYYVWDCAAGTGNLLAGLTNKYNIWASTLDKADVDAMKDRVRNGANLLERHCFQFDFLNDDFSTLPAELQQIIADPEKRKKLVVYINPPYAEAGSTASHRAKAGVSNETMVHDTFCRDIGPFAKRELFVQFLIRIYQDINGCLLANFSTLKNLQAPYFSDFRRFFRAKLEKIFVVPADTFDNVKGQFPIGFFIWDTEKKEIFERAVADVYDREGNPAGQKTFVSYDGMKFLNDWLRPHWIVRDHLLGYMACNGNDFQHRKEVAIVSEKPNKTSTFYKPITKDNLIMSSVYFAVRKCVEATWLNDRDQFLYPDDGWKTDTEFQNDSLAYTIFNTNIQSKYGVMTPNVVVVGFPRPDSVDWNRADPWNPFTEEEVGAREKFRSRFMSEFIAGAIEQEREADLFSQSPAQKGTPLVFSPEARDVFDAAREVWRYYHTEARTRNKYSANIPLYDIIHTPARKYNANASLYDIREYFQGRNEKGKMNNRSEDETYNELIARLRTTLKVLARKIEPKVYEYGFLKR